MKVLILVPSRVVSVDGAGRVLASLDWAPYAAVRSVEANLARDCAEVEFMEIDPDESGPIPAHKPPNELIDAAAFQVRFGALLQAYLAAVSEPEPIAPEPEAKPPSSLMARIEALELIVAGHARSFELINKMDLGGG